MISTIRRGDRPRWSRWLNFLHRHGDRGLGELRQTIFQEVVRLRIHREGVDLPRSGQAAHCLPDPRPGSGRGKKDLDLFAGGGVDRLQVHGDQQG
jgi:hypothetical protein